jgi:diguanylate cyclase (GGDEF)-like protein
VGVLPSTPIPGAIHAAEAIRENVKALKILYENSSVNWCITISLGIAGIVPTPGTLPAILIASADAALYQAKSSGRDKSFRHGFAYCLILHPLLSQLQFQN